MRKPKLNSDIFRIRREKLRGVLGDGVMIIAANSEKMRNHDVNHKFRQSSNFWYLTGFEEPDAILVLRPGRDVETIMYVREKDETAETWDGFRYGPDGASQYFGAHAAHTIEEFDDTIVDYLRDADRLFYQYHVNDELDDKLTRILNRVQRAHGRKGLGMLPVYDASTVIGELRIFKTDYELKEMQLAADISSEAHINMMKYTRPGVNERQVEGVFEMTLKLAGAANFAYPAIVATGDNATTLHYTFNDQTCEDGDLLLIDAGCEVNHYAADITRTFPVNGKFTEPQKRVYENVLAVQKELIDIVKPGIEFRYLRQYCEERLVDVMLDLGLLTGRREDLIESGEFRRYYPHGVGHWLGLDVHDAGLYEKGGEPRFLEPGMSFTIEPGLYIPLRDESAPEDYRGIGVRIEDNIVVTAQGCDNLTKEVPKEVADIEEVVGSGLNLPHIRYSAL